VLQPPPSIVVRVVEQPVHETTIADVIFGSLGLVGVMLIAAALAGLILGGGLILFKRLRHRDGLDAEDDGSNLRVTPMS
jgi:ABC-type nitrate/sulfonate/bicarbonate transport system permease component